MIRGTGGWAARRVWLAAALAGLVAAGCGGGSTAGTTVSRVWGTIRSAITSAIGKGAPQARREPARPPAVRIQTAPVQRITVQRQVDISGTLLSPDQAKVSSEVAGVVRQVLVELGTEVQQGQVLIRLEPRELALALERAESALRQTEAQLGIEHGRGGEPPPDEQIAIVRTATATRDDTHAQLNRATQLLARGLLPKVELDNAQTRVKVADANYQAAIENVHSLKASLQDRRAAYALAQKKLNDAAIRAPVAGSIAERLVQPGEFIRENTPVVTIVQMNPLKLKTAIQERYAGSITPDLPVRFRVESFPDARFEGTVANVSPAVDQTSRTFTVEAVVDNADRRLKPGFFAKGVILTRRDENVLAVTEDAVSTLAGVSTVYVVEQGKVRPQIVTLGVRQDRMLEIVTGLTGTEILATSNLNQLASGVSVQTGDATAADPPSDRGPVRRSTRKKSSGNGGPPSSEAAGRPGEHS